MMRRILLVSLLVAPLALVASSSQVSAAPAAKKKAAPAAAAPEAPKEPAADPADVIDVSKVERLLVFTDGKGHYVVTPKTKQNETLLFYGDGKTFYNQRVFGSGGSYDEKDGWSDVSYSFWEPRVDAGWKGSFGWKDGKVHMQCDTKQTELKVVPPDEAKKIIAEGKFYKPKWKRRAYALARDREGTYFYVDNLREPANAKAFKLYSGKKGEMKPLPLTNIVSDQEGDIFSTKIGDLRLVLDKSESSWTVKGKTNKLVHLDLEGNARVIYSELGVYSSSLGTPCDDLM